MTSTHGRATGRTSRRAPARVAAAAALTGAALLALAAPQASADTGPVPDPALSKATLAAARETVTDASTMTTLSRFFAREETGGRTSAASLAAAAPRIEGNTVPVRTLDPAFVAGEPGAPVARLDYLATTAVSADGRKASLWTAPANAAGTDWRVVNIATGDDETRYASAGARKLPGGTVFHEPQIDAWYVQKGDRVLPLDDDAVRAVGGDGTTLTAYRARVRAAYGDKLPGSGYARSGKAGGYAPVAAPTPGRAPGVLTTRTAGVGAGVLAVLALGGLTALRRHRGRRGATGA
ncbi:hypothetical protein ACPXCE_13215 [Streptomyces sp. DT24]|uniref:hypothetical protein n=1 Tax=unclassified Streptomyces TaxID=2593676 RepID=UPI003CF6B85D